MLSHLFIKFPLLPLIQPGKKFKACETWSLSLFYAGGCAITCSNSNMGTKAPGLLNWWAVAWKAAGGAPETELRQRDASSLTSKVVLDFSWLFYSFPHYFQASAPQAAMLGCNTLVSQRSEGREGRVQSGRIIFWGKHVGLVGRGAQGTKMF